MPRTKPRCSIAATAAHVGDAWTLIILREIFWGNFRYQGLQDKVGASTNILASRLNGLIDSGLIEKRPYQQRPLRYEYRLTERGRDLFPMLMELMGWGDRWLSGGSPLVALKHVPCGQITHPGARCSACGLPLVPEALLPLVGTGD